MEKINGYKIYQTNQIKTFRVNIKEKFIEFKPEWKAKLTKEEVLFCVKWAKFARIKGFANLTDIDTAAIRWYEQRYGKEAFNCFLNKITDKHLYHRLSFGHMVNKAQKSLWRILWDFITRKN